jgi:multisubunit Na+/H+ antiporter MnhB subunit
MRLLITVGYLRTICFDVGFFEHIVGGGFIGVVSVALTLILLLLCLRRLGTPVG